MKRIDCAAHDRTLFRLDFALRGHGAYVEPADIETLIAMVESASLALGAPLLRFIDDEQKKTAPIST
jgi:hypothetical protein